MSKQAATWLESNFLLSRPIVSFDRDASNGYLLLQAANQCGLINNDDFQAAIDNDDPHDAVKNITSLSNALQKHGVGISTIDVAGIVSEQPGAAVKVVMTMKKIVEKKKNIIQTQKQSTQSLFPSLKASMHLLSKVRGNDGMYLSTADTKKVFDSNNAVDIHIDANMAKFKIFGAIIEEAKMKSQANEIADAIERRNACRDELMDQSRRIRTNHRTFETQLLSDWKKQQEHHHKRQHRDLQFELATTKHHQLRQASSLQRAKEIVRHQLDDFEKKNLLSADDLESFNQTVNKAMVESEADFLKRLDKSIKSQLSSDGVRDFMTKLKAKLADKRSSTDVVNSRTLSANVLKGDDNILIPTYADKNHIMPASDDIDSDDDDMNLTSNMTSIDSDGNSSKARNSHHINKDRMDSPEVMQINEAQAARRERKHKAITSYCETVVVDIVDSIFVSGRSDSDNVNTAMVMSKEFQGSNAVDLFYTNPITIAKTMQMQLLSSHACSSTIGEGFCLPEIWPCYTAVGQHIGRWTCIQSNDNDQLSFSYKFIPSTVQDTRDDVGQVLLQSCPVDDLSMKPPHIRFPSLSITSSENIMVNASLATNHVPPIMILTFPRSHTYVDMSAMFDAMHCWYGAGLLVWDAMKALTCGMRLKDMYTEQGDQLSLASLVRSVGDEDWLAYIPSESTFTPSSQAMRVIAEVVDITIRIMNTASTCQVTSKKKSSTLPYSHASLAIISAHVLWLRLYATEAIRSIQPHDDNMTLMSFDRSILVLSQPAFNGDITTSIDRSDPMFVRLFDWFIRGNRRDNVPKEDQELMQAIDTDILGKINSKKSKSKTAQEVIADASPVSLIVQLDSSSSSPLAINDPVALFAPYVNIGMNDSTGNVSSYIEQIFRYFHSTKPVDTSKASASTRGKPPKNVFVEPQVKSDIPTMLLKIDPSVSTCNTDGDAVDMSSPIALAELMLAAILAGHDIRTPVQQLLDSMRHQEDTNSSELITSPSASSKVEAGIAAGSMCLLKNDDKPSVSDAADETYQMAIICLRDYRRLQLPAIERIPINHITGAHVLDTKLLAEIYSQLNDTITDSSTQLGAQAMVVDMTLRHLNRSIENAQHQHRNPLNSSEATFVRLCENIASKLLLLSKPSSSVCPPLETLLDELVCLMGDTLDSNHMILLSTTEQFSHTINQHAHEARDSLYDAFHGYGLSLMNAYQRRRDAIQCLCEALVSAGYSSSYPLNLNTTHGLKDKKQLQDKQEQVHIVYLKVVDIIESIADGLAPIKSRLDADNSIWLTFLSSGATSPSHSSPAIAMASTAITAMLCDCLDQACVVLTSISSAYEIVDHVKQSADACVLTEITRDHQQAHSSLHAWARTLKQSIKLDHTIEARNAFRRYLLSNPFTGKSQSPSIIHGESQLSLNTIHQLANVLSCGSIIDEVLAEEACRQDEFLAINGYPDHACATIKTLAMRTVERCLNCIARSHAMLLSSFSDHRVFSTNDCSLFVEFAPDTKNNDHESIHQQVEADASICEAVSISQASNTTTSPSSRISKIITSSQASIKMDSPSSKIKTPSSQASIISSSSQASRKIASSTSQVSNMVSSSSPKASDRIRSEASIADVSVMSQDEEISIIKSEVSLADHQHHHSVREEQLAAVNLQIRRLLQDVMIDLLSKVLSSKWAAIPMLKIYHLYETLRSNKHPSMKANNRHCSNANISCGYDQYMKHASTILRCRDDEVSYSKEDWKMLLEIVALLSMYSNTMNGDLAIDVIRAMIALCRCCGNYGSQVEADLLLQDRSNLPQSNASISFDILDIAACRCIQFATNMDTKSVNHSNNITYDQIDSLYTNHVISMDTSQITHHIIDHMFKNDTSSSIEGDSVSTMPSNTQASIESRILPLHEVLSLSTIHRNTTR